MASVAGSLLEQEDRRLLLAVARASIEHGLAHRRPVDVAAFAPSEVLRLPRACFVSLHQRGELRGCIGNLEPVRPLIEQAAENAYGAAFRDPRFAPLRPRELELLDIEVHVLSLLEPLPFDGLHDLYAKLRRGTDGLSLELGHRRAVFLPVMWETLPTPREFVARLLEKAGVPAGDPLTGLRASRFDVQVVEEP